MGSVTTPLIWAQAGGAEASSNPAAMAYLALRRWCGGTTLTSPRTSPDLEGLWVFLAALGVLFLIAMLAQGPVSALKQLFDAAGHVRLARAAAARVWRAVRLLAVAITFTVLSWTGAQSLTFLTEGPERGRADLLLLSRTRGRVEAALEQGAMAALTPLRDLAALGDNLPLLVAGLVLVFGASSAAVVSSISPSAERLRLNGRHGLSPHNPGAAGGWATAVWGGSALYVLYRLISRAAGGGDLPVGNCLVVEAAIIPVLMLLCDGFLLAWILVELRNVGAAGPGEVRLEPFQALELMPAAALGCLAALPSRYIATFVILAAQHVPAKAMATPLGPLIRWQLGPGLIVLQGGSLLLVGVVGVAAWGRGTISETLHAYGRLLAREGGRLVVVLAIAGAGCALASGSVYAVMLLLPQAGWVLAAADSYAHYATLPVGLWTLAALITLAEQNLPTASLVIEHRTEIDPALTSRGADVAVSHQESMSSRP